MLPPDLGAWPAATEKGPLTAQVRARNALLRPSQRALAEAAQAAALEAAEDEIVALERALVSFDAQRRRELRAAQCAFEAQVAELREEVGRRAERCLGAHEYR